MSFAAPAAGYDRFVGRYSVLIAPRFADFAGVAQDGPVLDVGCGPGALTQELAARIGAAHVAAVDPSEPFVAACKARVAGADVRVASGESLPFADHTFAIALSQLVLSFVQDPDRMAREMVRVVKPGGTVGLCMFEANGFALVRTFWDAAVAFDPGAPDDARRPFRRTEELIALCERAGLRDITAGAIGVRAAYDDFEDLWAPLATGIGPTAGYLVKQTPERREQIRGCMFELLQRPTAAFELPAKVLAVRGRVA